MAFMSSACSNRARNPALEGSYLGTGCKQSWGLWEMNPSSLDKQSVALTAEPSPQPQL